MGKVLIIDDDNDLRAAVVDILRDEGFATAEACDGSTALAAFNKEAPDAVLLDLRMPGMNGIEVMQRILESDSHMPVIIMTAHGDIPTAIEAIRNGAYDFTMKPPDYDKLIITLKRAVERRRLECDVDRISAALDASLEQIFGRSLPMKNVINQIIQVATTGLSVVVQGETGTGKSFIANAIHNASRRVKNPFIRVDMGLIPDTLFESELFGYKKGAFTGADRNKAGYFENANTGTIFIDEIENVPLAVQGKLLSVLDERQIYPLGSTNPVSIDVRVIAATNRDLRECVVNNIFRQDLFYRIGEFIIQVPPLRERTDDIPFFVNKFITEASSELDRQFSEITGEALDLLMRHAWAGNIRELKNVVRKAVLMSPGDVIDRRTVAPLLAHGQLEKKEFPLSIKEAVKEVEKANIREALRRTCGNKTKAAELLEISYKNLFDKIKSYGLE